MPRNNALKTIRTLLNQEPIPEQFLRYAAPAVLFSGFFLVVLLQGSVALLRNLYISPHPVGYVYLAIVIGSAVLGFKLWTSASNRLAIILMALLWLLVGFATIYRNAGDVHAATGSAAVSFLMLSIVLGARRALFALMPATTIAFIVGLKIIEGHPIAPLVGAITYFSNGVIAILISSGLLIALQEANTRLSLSLKRVENITALGEVGLFRLDFDRQMLEANRQYRRMFGYPPDSQEPIDFRDTLQRIPSMRDLSRQELHNLLDVVRLSGVNELEIELPGGEQRFLKTSFDKEIEDGKTYFSGSVVDVTALRTKTSELDVANSLLKKTVVTDELTGLMNRRAIRELDNEERRARFSSEASVVLMLDIDHFKSINDTYGHDAGDQVLVSIARILTDTFRATDLVVRWGGEEFLILLVGCTTGFADEVSEKLRRDIELRPIAAIGNKNVTVSIGVSMLDWNERTMGEAITAADKCLYRAKADGRNRVCTEW